MVGVVRMPVIPADEVGGGVTAGQVLPWEAEIPALRGSYRIDHGLMVCQQILVRNVATDLDVEVAAESKAGECGVEEVDHRLGVLMIRCNSRAHEAKRRREALKQIHLHPADAD